MTLPHCPRRAALSRMWPGHGCLDPRLGAARACAWHSQTGRCLLMPRAASPCTSLATARALHGSMGSGRPGPHAHANLAAAWQLAARPCAAAAPRRACQQARGARLAGGAQAPHLAVARDEVVGRGGRQLRLAARARVRDIVLEQRGRDDGLAARRAGARVRRLAADARRCVLAEWGARPPPGLGRQAQVPYATRQAGVATARDHMGCVPLHERYCMGPPGRPACGLLGPARAPARRASGARSAGRAGGARACGRSPRRLCPGRGR